MDENDTLVENEKLKFNNLFSQFPFRNIRAIFIHDHDYKNKDVHICFDCDYLSYSDMEELSNNGYKLFRITIINLSNEITVCVAPQNVNNVESPQSTLICPRCGVVVKNGEKHDEFHDVTDILY
jgi:hypothetical protein